MPKRQVRNAFYFYMIDFREQQKKIGIQYGNIREVSEAAGPSWREAPPNVRAKFEEMARQEKLKRNVPDQKFTSTGIPFSEIERQERELREAEEAEREYINNIVKLKSFNSEIIHEYFYVMDVNYYCKFNSDYLIGECTALRFNVKNGIKDQFHTMINPGPIPVGYAYDVKLGAQELGLDMPDAITYKTLPYIDTLAIIVDYLKHGLPTSSKTVPPIYTMPERVQPVLNFILQMCAKTGEDDGMFRVYKLDTLFYTLLNGIKNRGDEGFPRESLALAQLKKDPFRYTPGLGCRHHEDIDKAAECTTSRVKRWAYTIMDSCCPVVGVDMLPSKHVPGDFDLDVSVAGVTSTAGHRQGCGVHFLSREALGLHHHGQLLPRGRRGHAAVEACPRRLRPGRECCRSH
ncbi:protein maelstrom homolog isoform X1 [Ostrinia nubilalis]|uniref:protein maelstrom homolog isoform X1 n=2 Tax=Ostrinia nubilalis TaxID=29057 RepID=UPI003082654C